MMCSLQKHNASMTDILHNRVSCHVPPSAPTNAEMYNKEEKCSKPMEVAVNARLSFFCPGKLSQKAINSGRISEKKNNNNETTNLSACEVPSASYCS